MRHFCSDDPVFSGSKQELIYILHAIFYLLSPHPGASHGPGASQFFCSPGHVTQDVWLASRPTSTTATKYILGEGEDLFLL
jgi:hypothetical protein